MANYQNSPVKKLNPVSGVKKIGIAVSEWNSEVTEALYSGCYSHLIKSGISKEQIVKIMVPGSFELPLACQRILEDDDFNGAIALGCIIQGETRHFEFICQAVAHGITDVSLKFGKPAIFGVLTTNNQKQAIDRAGGKHGNKGEEAAYTLLKMLT